MFALMSVLPCSLMLSLSLSPGNKLMSSRPASCLIWPPPECHFEFTSQVRKEEERERGAGIFRTVLVSGSKEEEERREGPVRSFAHACVAAACGMVTRL